MGPRFRICRGCCHKYRLSYPELLGLRFWRAPCSPENSQTKNSIVTKGPRIEAQVWILVPWPNYVLFSLQVPTQSQAWNVCGVRRLHEKGKSQSHSMPQAPRATVRKCALPGLQLPAPPPPRVLERAGILQERVGTLNTTLLLSALPGGLPKPQPISLGATFCL